MLTMSSSGSREWHLISVKTFFPMVQQASSRTNSMWYRSGELSSIRLRSERIMSTKWWKEARSL